MPSSQSLRLSSPIPLPAASLPCWNSSFDQIQTRNPRPSRRFQHCSFHGIGRLVLEATGVSRESRCREANMTVKAILGGKGAGVFSIEPTATVETAIKTLGKHNIGALLVLGPDRRVIGILSERDI